MMILSQLARRCYSPQLARRCYHPRLSAGYDPITRIFTSPLGDIPLPPYDQSISEFVTSKWGEATIVNKLCFTSEDASRNLTFGETSAIHLAMRRYLNTGIGTIAIIMGQSQFYLPITLAAFDTNRVLSTVNPAYTPHEMAKQVEAARAALVLTDSTDVYTNMKRMGYETILVNDEFVDSINNDDNINDNNVAQNINRDATAVLPYSSGTTGLPKGTKLSQNNIHVNLIQINASEGISFDNTNTSSVISPLPLFHIYGFTLSMLYTAMKGCTLITQTRFDLDSFCQLTAQHKPSRAYLVPPICLLMAKNKDSVLEHDMSSIKSVTSGAAPISPELTDEFNAAFPTIKLKQAWGMTELSPVGTFNPDWDVRDGTIGCLLPGTEGKIVSIESGETIDATEEDVVGELCIKGPQVMQGYLDNDEATHETIKNGWLHTGDIASADKDGWITITDRLKELIKVAGWQVAPAELEGVLLSHPNVIDCAVIGIPDDEKGEAPKAFVVLGEAGAISEEELKSFIKERLISYKQLKSVEFIEAIPKSASGKILRRQLR